MATACPTLHDFLKENMCQENMGGLGTDLYAFVKTDLAAKLAIKANSENEYTLSSASFKSGKGLVKIQAKEETVKLAFESLGKRKGYKQTLTFSLDAVNSDVAANARALNNNEIGFIVQDGEVSYIVYDPIRDGTFESGGIQGDTGAAAADDRKTDFTYVLQPTKYGVYLVETPEEGWDSLLASATGA